MQSLKHGVQNGGDRTFKYKVLWPCVGRKVQYVKCPLMAWNPCSGGLRKDLSSGEPSCVIFFAFVAGIFWFVGIQKWNGYRPFGGISFVGME